MNGTLPLFLDIAPQDAASTLDAGPPAAGGGDEHLRAAWRLSRAMWRFPERSAAETRAGLAICHHLQELLAPSGSDQAR